MGMMDRDSRSPEKRHDWKKSSERGSSRDSSQEKKDNSKSDEGRRERSRDSRDSRESRDSRDSRREYRESKDLKGKIKSNSRSRDSSTGSLNERIKRVLIEVCGRPFPNVLTSTGAQQTPAGTQQQPAGPPPSAHPSAPPPTPSSSGLQPPPSGPPPPQATPPEPRQHGAWNENNDDNGANNNDTDQGKREREQGQQEGAVGEVRVVQEARIWPPVNGQHPKLKDAKEAYPDIPKGHPKLLMLWADKSEFGKWVWLPKNKNYYGSTPRNGIAARVEKV